MNNKIKLGLVGAAALLAGCSGQRPELPEADAQQQYPAVKPTVTTTAVCRGPVPLISVDLGPAPPGYPDVDAAVFVDAYITEQGPLRPGDGLSTTVQESGRTPVVVVWPDETVLYRVLDAPRCLDWAPPVKPAD